MGDARSSNSFKRTQPDRDCRFGRIQEGQARVSGRLARQSRPSRTNGCGGLNTIVTGNRCRILVHRRLMSPATDEREEENQQERGTNRE